MITRAGALHALEAVTDPELPVLTIADLGILRDVVIDGDAVVVTITPTYSGCPAMAEIRADVVAALTRAGAATVTVDTALSPAWTTDWMSEQARDKLRAYGIAPPTAGPSGPVDIPLSAVLGSLEARRTAAATCPQCGSPDTEELSRFGSTSCKSLWRCRSCREPFDLFKDH
ncbi:MAG: paaJ [Modestobacter sp.]|nr:paaJ [Modestobacter sp.]